jgi:hypothetical protein
MRYFLKQSVHVKYALLFFVFFIGIGSKNSFAQTFNGKWLSWQLDKPNENRLKFKFGTIGQNFGSEATACSIENVSSSKLFVEIKLTKTDFCGGNITTTISATVKPHEKVGGSTWMGIGQHDYTTSCKQNKKYGEKFITKIFTVSLQIVSIKNLDDPNPAPGPKPGTNPNPDPNPVPSPGTNPRPTTNPVTDPIEIKTCPTFGFKFSNTPSYNCVALEWWALSTKVNMIDANGNFNQSNNPEAKYFTIQFRKQGDVYWTSEKRDNTGRNVHTLTGLDACSKYEVRLITSCDNNIDSNPSNIVRFTTACNKPAELIIEDIKDNSAKISSKRQLVISYPCSSAKTQIRSIEFKTSTTAWDEVICNTGSPCFLSALSPNTTYRVRARYKYGNALFSNYTNEVSFTTTGSQESSNSSTGSFGSSGNATGTLKVPTIEGPPNGKKVTGYYFELSWKGVLNATSYEVLIANNMNFVNASTFKTANTKYAPSNYGTGPVYYWKIRAKGANGKYSFWSPVATFWF